MPKTDQKRWQAQITEAGRFYLDHGHHPDRPSTSARTATTAASSSASGTREAVNQVAKAGKQTADPAPRRSSKRKPPAPTKASRPVNGPALIEEVQQAGRFLRIPDPTPEDRAWYRRAFDAARTCAPEGFALKYSGRAKGDFFLGLLRTSGKDDTEWNRIRLQRSRVITDVEEVIAALRADYSAYEVSEEVLPRVLGLVRLLAEGALGRHGDIAVSKKRRQPRPLLTVQGRTYELGFRERQRQVKAVPAAEGRRKTYDWQRVTPVLRTEPSGELELTLAESHPYGYSHGWTHETADTAKRPLEVQIDTVFRALKTHAEEQEQARLDREVEERQRQAERERQEAERRRLLLEEQERTRQEWEAAVAVARKKAARAARTDRFATALDQWRAVGEIRAFCAELDVAAGHAEDLDEAERLLQWADWGRAEADRVDPARAGNGLSVEDFDAEPVGDALRPYLKGWSPLRPVKEKPPEEPTAPQRQPDPWREINDERRDQGWRYGRQGHAQWWRR